MSTTKVCSTRFLAVVWGVFCCAAMPVGVLATAWLLGSYWGGLDLGGLYFLVHLVLAVMVFRDAPLRTARAFRWVAGALAWVSLPCWYLALRAWQRPETDGSWVDMLPNAVAAGAVLLLCSAALFLASLRFRSDGQGEKQPFGFGHNEQ